VIGVVNYVIAARPSLLDFVIADTDRQSPPAAPAAVQGSRDGFDESDRCRPAY
jgi:hypothetical protein